MTISLELEELKADYLEDLNRSLKKQKPLIFSENLKSKIEASYEQFFFDFYDDFTFNHFCIWLEANTGIKLELA